MRWRGYGLFHDSWDPVCSFVPRINTLFMGYVRRHKTKLQVSNWEALTGAIESRALISALSSPLVWQIERKSVRSSERALLACSLPALVQCGSYGGVEMLRKSSSALAGWLDTAVACLSDLSVMPTSQSGVRRNQSCSLYLSCGWVVMVGPLPAESEGNQTGTPPKPRSAGQSSCSYLRLLNAMKTRWIAGIHSPIPECHPPPPPR